MRFSRLVYFAAIVLVSAAAPIPEDDNSSLLPDVSWVDTSSTETLSTETSRDNTTDVPGSSQHIKQTKANTETKDVYDLTSINTRLQRRDHLETSGRQRRPLTDTPFQRRARKKSKTKGNDKGDKRPGKKTNSAHKPTVKTNKKPPKGLGTKPRPKKSLDLLPAIEKFDMLTNFEMAGTSPSTQEISPGMMLRAGMPSAITFKMVPYSFPTSPNLFRARTQAAYDRAMVMLEQASLVKLQSSRPISGEVDLTQIMQQTMGSVVNEILAAIGVKSARWHMVGLGKGAIPDIALTELKANGQSHNPRAVIEVKTTSSLTEVELNQIIDQVEKEQDALRMGPT